eukprot:COSAG03_NODE_867_length_5583_cov_35.557826_3_plen_84_part_00
MAQLLGGCDACGGRRRSLAARAAIRDERAQRCARAARALQLYLHVGPTRSPAPGRGRVWTRPGAAGGRAYARGRAPRAPWPRI